MRVSVKNTFLDTEPQDLQALAQSSFQGRRRAKTLGAVWPPQKQLTTLEQATLDSLHGLLGYSDESLNKFPHEKTAAISSIDCAASLSTMCLKDWDDKLECGLYSAGERAKWVVQNCGLSLTKARLRVMHEFPTNFGPQEVQSEVPEERSPEKLAAPKGILSNSSLSTMCPEDDVDSVEHFQLEDWDDEEFCGGHTAYYRANWLVENRGLSLDEARLQVMQEFPMQFSRPHRQSGRPEGLTNVMALEQWDCNMFCDGLSAGDRAKWVVENSGVSLERARLRVMWEFPNEFSRPLEGLSAENLRLHTSVLKTISSSEICKDSSAVTLLRAWRCNVICSGHSAGDRAKWVVENCGLSWDKARLRVMCEFPTQFGSKTTSGAESVLSSSDASTHCRAPKSVNFAEEFSRTPADAPPTSMMLLHLPIRYTQHELIEELESLGFADSFDFFYAPYNFSTKSTVGYAFVNFVSPAWAAHCQRVLDGYAFRKHQQKMRTKYTSVTVAHLQGFEANFRHYESAAVKARGRSRRCGPVILNSTTSTAAEPPCTAEN